MDIATGRARLNRAGEVAALLLVELPVWIIACALDAVLRWGAGRGLLNSVHRRRAVIACLRRVPTRGYWRAHFRRLRLRRRPFALDLQTADAADFIGRTEREISGMLRADPTQEFGLDHGLTVVRWERGGFRVECHVVGTCRDCVIEMKDGTGCHHAITRAPR
ncbi:hypothetical protein [Stenotrophomonas sp. GZD-301]|uniref:hypothetical protein n=1 Tax=Stenotrophomonas sp. GZD-301 TaxID=3404814 RepID=UPI003BB6E3D1